MKYICMNIFNLIPIMLKDFIEETKKVMIKKIKYIIPSHDFLFSFPRLHGDSRNYILY